MIIDRVIRASLVLLTVIFLSAGPVLAENASFTADLSLTAGGDSVGGKIFVTPSYYRMEIEPLLQNVVVVVNRESDSTRLLIHETKEYLDMSGDDAAGIMLDLFQVRALIESYADKEHVDTEILEGYDCDKYVLSRNGKKLMTYWISSKLDFPCKIIDHLSDDGYMIMVNIEVGAVEDSMFVTPPDYTEMTSIGETSGNIADWAGDIVDAPVMTPPFEMDMSAGDIVRVKAVTAKSIWVKASAWSDSGAEARAIPFKDGKALSDLSMYTNFARDGLVCERRHELAIEADEIIVRVFQGSMTVSVKYSPMQEVSVGAGESYAYDITSRDPILIRSVNTAPTGSEFIIRYSEAGKELSPESIDPQSFRTVLLDAGTASGRTVNPFGDTMIIRVTKGSVALKVGQFDNSEW